MILGVAMGRFLGVSVTVGVVVARGVVLGLDANDSLTDAALLMPAMSPPPSTVSTKS